VGPTGQCACAVGSAAGDVGPHGS
jgi:hypothetical protein